MELFDIHESIVKLWTPIILVHFVSSATVICFVSINLIMSTGIDTLLYSNYILTVLIQLIIYAVGGTRIAESVRIMFNYSQSHADTNARMDFDGESMQAFSLILCLYVNLAMLSSTFCMQQCFH